MNTFWLMIASNAAIATIMAIVAMLLGRIWRNAAAIHLLWVIVLLKLFTPPLFIAEMRIASPFVTSAGGPDFRGAAMPTPARDESAPAAPAALANGGGIAADEPRDTTGHWFAGAVGHESWSYSALLAAIWIGGAGCTAAVQTVRIRRFASVIRDCAPAPSAIRTMVARLSSRLGLRRVPGVRMTSRALPPLVWSTGTFPCVVLPSELFARLGSEAQDTILAHELVHIRRRDHLVRLLELAATTVFWWHPVVWWASRQLRELEEVCCDGRVLELLPYPPRTYAAALVDTWEFLSELPRTPVPLRTAIHSTGSLSRRIRMLTRSRTNRLGALSATLVVALVAFPLVVALSADPGQTGQPAAGAPAAVLRGRVTDEAGAPLADVRVQVAIPATNMQFLDAGGDPELGERGPDPRRLEARTDAGGDYRLEISGIAGRTPVSIDAMKPGYRRLSGTLMAGGDDRRVDVVPGTPAEASLTLKPALYFKGIVVDEQGKPIPAVEVSANAVIGRGSGGVERTVSRADGTFEVFNYPPKTDSLGKELGKGIVHFSHPDYLGQKSDEIYAMPSDRRESLRIVLGTGHKVTGTVLDAAGKPVPHAMVEAARKDGSYRKATRTDAHGKFALRGLSEGPTMVGAHNFDIKQTVSLPMDLNADKLDLEVRLRPMSLPADLVSHAVLGMQLADVTPELKSAYEVFNDRGALILDPGKDSDRLKIGRLAEGYTFWMVGQKRIGSVRGFVNQILAEAAGQSAEEYSIRVVYTFRTVNAVGTNTQYLKLKKDDLKSLQVVSDRLATERR